MKLESRCMRGNRLRLSIHKLCRLYLMWVLGIANASTALSEGCVS